MKRSFLLYAFILLVLINVFTYSFLSNEVKFEQDRYQRTSKRLKDSLNSLNLKLNEANYFSLEKNENAQNYFDSAIANKTIQYEKLIPVIKEKLMDLNANPKGNPYTGQDQIGENKFVINKVKVLNHRWIIADYSDGKMWGEVLLKYFVNEDESVSFEVMQSLLYAQ
ncbi:hypothetical protein SAMN05192550_3303 [Flavobacterium glycines]|uniref:Hydrolase n=1 Tax=Flavobacterium glycines TaxID=551990 RepID=A0A1B9DTS1_9FLAO|nr:hypothetical protein [Flavobacterium glycines]OCB73100.1 hypothetical protein FBGL_03410 [Flavobacterium glycines]GEL12362.1 hypothetical protein FGL01_31010 [Flavobacterium glycines]SDK08318.1 hypothetical protein SAMN05192550_3303 [Flavobacterium glycines]